MNAATITAIAQELMDIQMGSAEDAKNLLDDNYFDSDELWAIRKEIDRIATEMGRDLE
jgi:hypothetical protein